MLSNPFYHGILRKLVIAFGSLFSNVYIERKQGDSVDGETSQRLHVPIAYAPKEKWIVRLEQDPELSEHTYTSVPRLSFEIVGYSYDSERKLNKMNQIVQQCRDSESGAVTSTNRVYTPVPYDIEISLYALTKTTEDAMQIVEQILPTFTPDYTLSVNVVPSMGIIHDIPIILNSASIEDEFEGDFQTRRFVTHTFNFTLKANLYGGIRCDEGGLIENVQDTGEDSAEGGDGGVRIIDLDDEELIYNRYFLETEDGVITRDEWEC